MIKNRLHIKQRNFLLKYLKYYVSIMSEPDCHWDRVNLIASENCYTDEAREFLNAIRNQCRHLAMGETDEPNPLRFSSGKSDRTK